MWLFPPALTRNIFLFAEAISQTPSGYPLPFPSVLAPRNPREASKPLARMAGIGLETAYPAYRIELLRPSPAVPIDRL